MPRTLLIPEHEPEVVAAFARRLHGGDMDPVHTTALTSPVVRGVRLSSRHCKAHELRRMAAIVMGLPTTLVDPMRSMVCDGDTGQAYTIRIAPWDLTVASSVAEAVDELSGGHGGIDILPCVTPDRAAPIHVDGYWPDDADVDDQVP